MSILSDFRALLDLIESEPVLRDAETVACLSDGFLIGAWSEEELAAMIRAAHGTIDSPVTKQPRESSYQTYKRRFGSAVLTIVDYTLGNDRCEQVQVGTKQVEKTIVVVPAVTTTEIVDEPVFEWKCGPVLAAAAPTVDEIELPPTAVGWTDDTF